MVLFTLLTFHFHSCVESGCEWALWAQLETFHSRLPVREM